MQIICIIKNLLGENQYMMWETFYDLLLDALIDSLKLLPFLFGAYLLIEWVEHRASGRLAHSLKKAGRFGPLVGALAGCVPQCGFSVVAANFYSGGIITMGTLVAVFLSTSDEALPILLAHPDQLWAVGALLGGKVAIGLFAGFLIDLLFRRSVAEEQQLHHQEMCSHCHCEQGIFRSALRHSLQIFLFLFGVSLALGAAIHFVGQERLSSLLMAGSIWQPLIAGIIGLIPNCASSVLITELYLSGALSFGAAMAGLCTGTGMGVLVLFRIHRNWKENLQVLGLTMLFGVLAGELIGLLEYLL